MDTHDELRDELIAVLRATRELSPDTDRELAEAFVRRVERLQPVRVQAARRPARRRPDPLSWARNAFIALFAIMLLLPLLMGAAGVSLAVFLSPDEILRHVYWSVLPLLYTSFVPIMYVCALMFVAACVVAFAYAQRLSAPRAE